MVVIVAYIRGNSALLSSLHKRFHSHVHHDNQLELETCGLSERTRKSPCQSNKHSVYEYCANSVRVPSTPSRNSFVAFRVFSMRGGAPLATAAVYSSVVDSSVTHVGSK